MVKIVLIISNNGKIMVSKGKYVELGMIYGEWCLIYSEL